jgi:hypothetical protein
MLNSKKQLCLFLLLYPALAFSQTIYYDTRYSVLENFKRGFADTFHVDNYVFRIVADTSEAPEYRFQLEKQEGSTWAKRFSFGFGIGFHNPDYNRKVDFNCDNYNDLLVFSSRGGGAYVYDSAAGEFISTPFKRPYDWKVLNTQHRLVCSLDYDPATGNGVSLLYTFSGFNIYPLYYMAIKTSADGYKKTCILYKCSNGDIETKTKVEEKIFYTLGYEFFHGFWKTRYKKLLAYD